MTMVMISCLKNKISKFSLNEVSLFGSTLNEYAEDLGLLGFEENVEVSLASVVPDPNLLSSKASSLTTT